MLPGTPRGGASVPPWPGPPKSRTRGPRGGGAAGHVDIDGDHRGRSPEDFAGVPERAAGDAAGPDGQDHPGLGHAHPRLGEGVAHRPRDGSGDEQGVGMSGRSDEVDPEPLQIVRRPGQGLDLDLTSVATARVDHPHGQGALEPFLDQCADHRPEGRWSRRRPGTESMHHLKIGPIGGGQFDPGGGGHGPGRAGVDARTALDAPAVVESEFLRATGRTQGEPDRVRGAGAFAGPPTVTPEGVVGGHPGRSLRGRQGSPGIGQGFGSKAPPAGRHPATRGGSGRGRGIRHRSNPE